MGPLSGEYPHVENSKQNIKIQELIELSENEFVVIDDPVEFISAKTMRSISRPSTKTVTHG
jgi:hypothetical protein